MKLLLDTRAALWFLEGDSRLSDAAREHLVDDANETILSAVVVWEVAIKRALGKLEVTDEYLLWLRNAGIVELPMTLDHAAAVEDLPHHHGDPFDRLLVAQATVEGAAIVSGDPKLAPYDVRVVW